MLWAACLVPLGGCAAGERAKAPLQDRDEAMTLDDRDFLSVIPNTLGPTQGSPSRPADPAFRGIVIRAPRKVAFKKGAIADRDVGFALVPICGYYRLDLLLPDRYSDLHEAIVLVATDLDRKEVFSGRTADPDLLVPPPGEPASTPGGEQSYQSGPHVYGGYFNPNLVQYARLPRRSATYEVHAELEGSGVRSNRVTIELVETP